MKRILIFMLLFMVVSSGFCQDLDRKRQIRILCSLMKANHSSLERMNFAGREWIPVIDSPDCVAYIAPSDITRKGGYIRVPMLCILTDYGRERIGAPYYIIAYQTDVYFDCKGGFRYRDVYFYDDAGRYKLVQVEDKRNNLKEGTLFKDLSDFICSCFKK